MDSKSINELKNASENEFSFMFLEVQGLHKNVLLTSYERVSN